MTDEHKKLTAEYERLVKGFETGSAVLPDIVKALLHILKRLGPPTAEEAADIGIAEDRT